MKENDDQPNKKDGARRKKEARAVQRLLAYFVAGITATLLRMYVLSADVFNSIAVALYLVLLIAFAAKLKSGNWFTISLEFAVVSGLALVCLLWFAQSLPYQQGRPLKNLKMKIFYETVFGAAGLSFFSVNALVLWQKH